GGVRHSRWHRLFALAQGPQAIQRGARPHARERAAAGSSHQSNPGDDMTDFSQAPTRLLDDPSQSELLRGDLQIASAHAPLPYDVAAGFERFEQATRAGASGSSAGPASGLRVLGWIVGAAVLVGGGIGATFIATAP